MGSIAFHPMMEVQRLIKIGLLTKGMNYCINPVPATLVAFCSRLEGRTLLAEISHNNRSPTGVYSMIVTEEVDGEDAAIVSSYNHDSLEHLVRTGRALLCYHDVHGKPVRKPSKPTVTVRIDEDLRQAFDAAAEAAGESQAVVIRQLMRYFVGKGPDPRMVG
jgi:uncharacterized protein (DUF4415 family)